MYHTILVPLDRSSYAEQALPLALSIARRANARLDLVEVHSTYTLDSPGIARATFEPARDAKRKQDEQLYLDATANWVRAGASVPTTVGVLPGSAVLSTTVANSLVERVHNSNADLIVIATHGRGPLGRFGFGSVADELVQRAGVPILVVRPVEPMRSVFTGPALDRILVPLDGSPLAEQVLEPTLELARLMEAECMLLRVIESAPEGAVNRHDKDQAEAYLERVATKLREQGVQAGTRIVVARRAADAILAEAEGQASNLIAMATHGRGGFKRLLLGSVADKLVRRARSPLLVYRPLGEEPRPSNAD